MTTDSRSNTCAILSIRILTILFLLLVGSIAHSQQQEEVDPGPLADFNKPATSSPEEADLDGDAGSSSPIFPQVWCGDVDDEATKESCWDAYRAGLAYYKTGLEHRTRVFAWQHFSTLVIFLVVLILVAAGIFFAWIQFNRGDPTEKSELEISVKGFKITSPIIGLIILTLSLAFFYLYLVHVYPINELI